MFPCWALRKAHPCVEGICDPDPSAAEQTSLSRRRRSHFCHKDHPGEAFVFLVLFFLSVLIDYLSCFHQTELLVQLGDSSKGRRQLRSWPLFSVRAAPKYGGQSLLHRAGDSPLRFSTSFFPLSSFSSNNSFFSSFLQRWPCWVPPKTVKRRSRRADPTSMCWCSTTTCGTSRTRTLPCFVFVLWRHRLPRL